MKKILTVTTAFAMTLGLAACISVGSTTGSSESSSSAATTSAATEATSEATEATSEATSEVTVSTSEATVSTGGASEPTTGTASDDSAETLTVTATNNGAASVIWTFGASMGAEDFEGEWTEQVELTDEADVLTVTVIGDATVDNEVTCTITDSDGKVVDQITASGQNSATCTYVDSL